LTFQFEIGGRIRDVAVRRLSRASASESRGVERGFEVTLDGRPCVADLVGSGSGWSLLVGPVEVGRIERHRDVGGGSGRPMRSFEVAIEHQPEGATVYVEGTPIPVRTRGPAGRFGRRGVVAAQGGSGPRRIVAPMPGRVVKVLVKPGDIVDARQGLVVVEAMKMENELRAPGAGTVTEVKVTEGASVEANTVLVVIS
jgi:biotin carboxyl carrier protein